MLVHQERFLLVTSYLLGATFSNLCLVLVSVL